jgi:hypothetical protein
LNLRDRLERLRREPPPGLEALPALEREVVGDSGEGLSLKQRLERLVGAATSTAARRPRAALEAVAPGRVVSTERGEFYMLEHALHVDRFHGDVPMARLRSLPRESLEILMGEPAFASLDATRTVFLDTETTGLAGGAGTAAFLIGPASSKAIASSCASTSCATTTKKRRCWRPCRTRSRASSTS